MSQTKDQQQDKIVDDDAKFVTLRDIVEDPKFCFTMPMLRHYVKYAHANGLAVAIRRLGTRKIIVRRDLFINWIEKQAQR